jgi:Core-2/I-Branching enzyme
MMLTPFIFSRKSNIFQIQFRAISILFLLSCISWVTLALDHWHEEQLDVFPYTASRESVSPSMCSCTVESDKSNVARIAYLIIVHNYQTLEDAALLFQAIRSVHNLIFIHVDRKVGIDAYYDSTLYEQVRICPCGSSVLAKSVYSAEWSTWSMNYPTLWGMEQALRRRDEWDVFINLSGDSFPVYKQNIIGNLFATELKGINFVTSSSCETGLLPTNIDHFPEWWHKRKHYLHHPEGDVPISFINDRFENESITLKIHFGSQWVALQPDFCDYIIRSLENEDSLPSRFRDYLVKMERRMTDETFLPTLLMHVAPFNKTSLPRILSNRSLATRPTMSALRYERMDEHAPSAFGVVTLVQHYEVAESSIADSSKPWGPYFLGLYDLRSIRSSGALFIRKVSQFVEPNIIRFCLLHLLTNCLIYFGPKSLPLAKK